ncbi:MAG: family 16 glycoside hydrolase [Saprospiraceae bacterium]
MKKLFCLVLLFSLLFIFSCQEDVEPTFEADRPFQPWVFRSVLDLQPRMLTLALDDKMWAAYHADNGALYKVWKGNVELTGAVYDTYHGPQPVSLGDAYLVNKHKTPWEITLDGKTETAKTIYKGHRKIKNQVEVLYDLVLSNGNKINVAERPEYIESESGQPGFERVFTLTNVPAGAKVLMKTNASSVVSKEKVETDGNLNYTKEESRQTGSVTTLDVEGTLEMNASGKTRLACVFVKNPTIENSNKKSGEEGVAEVERTLGERLIDKSDCKACHNAERKTIGPSYVDIAKRYPTTPENVSTLVEKIQKGGSGNWGNVLMSAHPNLSKTDAEQMVDYILGLAESEAGGGTATGSENSGDYQAAKNVEGKTLLPGLIVQIQQYDKNILKLADLDLKKKPIYAGVSPQVTFLDADFKGLEKNFALIGDGYISIPEDDVYTFRLISDDGSQLLINGKQIVDNDGLHGAELVDGSVALKKGLHEMHLEFFQGYGGKNVILQWKAATQDGFMNMDIGSMMHDKVMQNKFKDYKLPLVNSLRIPGDGYSLTDVHPSYDLSQARPDDFLPKVGGMDFLPDGKLVVSTWDADGAIYTIEGAQGGDPTKMKATKIADGIAEPLGVKVVDGDIYVLQKQELTRLKDLDGDGIMDEYQTVSNDWLVSANFHEFAFGLVYKDGYFYAALATGIMPGGASKDPQVPDRGKVVKISKDNGTVEFLAHGLRTPNGIGIGTDGEIFVADNQGDWLPSSKIVHVQKGAWYGSRSVDFEGTADLKENKPVVWLPQDEIGNSPSTPLALNDGIYKGQMIHGEVTHGGVKRVFVEKVNGEYQGCVFRFIQGLEGGVNRMVWGPDGALYVGCIGNPGNWAQNNKLWYGVQRLKYNNTPTFEMLAVRAKSNGVEIEFTEALAVGDGWDKNGYQINQWMYLPTKEYGGPKLNEEELRIVNVNVSEDRKKVFLELNGMKEDRVVHVKLKNHLVSEKNNELWSTEGWYTMNAIPKDQNGFTSNNTFGKIVDNQLAEHEKAAGWELLFNGKDMSSWRNFKKETIGTSWIIDNNAIHLNSLQNPDGTWSAKEGGDIITKNEYENFELRLEWKIGACGNSGIMFNVVEDDKYHSVWLTGPEMQVLDNTCHPDTKYPTHRAGDLYDMIACKYVVVKPAGEWNKVRLISKNGKMEHWLNGRKVVEYEMHTDEWKEMIANSKFKDMPDFGLAKKGHISLQDHSDKVWFKNIKILKL